VFSFSHFHQKKPPFMLPATRLIVRRGTRSASVAGLSRSNKTLVAVRSIATINTKSQQQTRRNPSSLLQKYGTMSNLHPSRSLATSAAQQPNLTTGATLEPLQSLPEGYEIRTTVGSSKVSAPYAVYTGKMEMSSLDDRTYRLLRLQNGLEALVIQDPETDKSSAAMDVRVGHLSDPIELQGLAHFCEHLLFMGTEKYPRENEYSEYLSNHSGSSNAYTGMENTNYFFDVGHKHLEGALDRFAQFFLHPLFDPSCTEREIRAVDSEHKKNLQSDAWRAFQLDKSLSDPNHPYSHFGTGNAKTLWDDPRNRGMDVRDELLKFHDRYYSANVMKLVVLGRESVDTLTQWAVDKFSGVRNKGLAAPTFPANPFGPEQLQTQVFFRSVKDIRLLDLSFPIPDQSPLFRTKPGQFLSHFIGHEGQGSILSYLKAQGWANHLSAGAMNGADGFEFFKISIDLTAEGLTNYDKVVAAVFRYVDLLKQSPVPEWSFKEVQQLCDLAFRFKEKQPPSSYTSGLSSQLQLPFPREWVLSGPFLAREFDPQQIREVTDRLSPSNCRISIAAQAMPDGSQNWDMKERWYGTEYKVTPLKSVTDSSVEANAMSLPQPNSFIPTTFDVPGAPTRGHQKPRPSLRPVLAQNSPLSRLWHKKDDQFFLPKANVFLLLRSPLIDATPNNAVRCRMLVELIKDALTEYSYDAELAGLGYNIESQGDAIGLSVDGYNDKLPVLLRYILEQFASFKVDKERFEIIKDQVRRGYQNFRLEAPFQHANYYTSYLTVERIWNADEKLSEMEHITAEDVQQFLHEVRARMHLEMLAHGNIDREEAKNLLNLSETILGPRPLAPTEQISARSLILEPNTNARYAVAVPNDKNVNSSIEYYCQVGDPADVPLRATLSLLSQIAQEPAFDQLRTKEQLGYLVFSGVRKSIGSMGFRIIVQSERSSDYLESRIDEFFRVNMHGLLQKMTPEEFEAQKESLIRKKMEKVKNLFDESSRYWFHIFSGYCDFLQRQTDIEALRKVTKDDVVRLFEKYIWPESKEGRSKLTVHVQSQIEMPRFSIEAYDAFAEQAQAKGWTDAISEDIAKQVRGQELSLEMVKGLIVRDESASNATEVTALLDELAAKYPVEQDDTKLVRHNPKEEKVNIDQAVHFKASLRPSKAAVPVRSLEEMSAEPSAKEHALAEEEIEQSNKPVSANL
jgi:insulysin